MSSFKLEPKKQLLIVVLLFYNLAAHGQTRYCLDELYGITTLESCTQFADVQELPNGWKHVRLYNRVDSMLQMEGYFSAFPGPNAVEEGTHQYFFPGTDTIWYTELYKKGAIKKRESYYSDGKLRRVELFERDSLISGKCYKPDGSEDDFLPFKVQPSFVGGEQTLYSHLKVNLVYPQDAIDNNIQGVVLISFLVEKDGQLSDFILLKDPGYGLGAEALRVLKSLQPMIAGTIDGQITPMRIWLPIRFKLG